MIDLTPLDVRNKRGDFKKKLGGGYDPADVDVFLEIVAERLEMLVRENMTFRERSDVLERQVASQSGREQAVQEALVTAQELRSDIREQAQREADHILKEAETEGRRLVAEAQAEVVRQLREAERRLEQGRDALEELERRRSRFLKSFRQLLDREMDVVVVEEERPPLEDRPIDLDLGGGRFDPAPAYAPPPPGAGEQVEASPAEAPHEDDDGGVDVDPAERPPLDAPVDELAAGYDPPARDASEPRPPVSDDGALFLSFDAEAAPDPVDPRTEGGNEA